MLSHSILLALLAVGANAFLNFHSRSLSIYATVDHITKYKPSSLCTGAAIKTTSRTRVRTITSTITTCSSPTTVTTTVTPSAVTLTADANAPELAGRLLRADLDVVCASTTTVSPAVATVYTGVYNGTLAKRTASPLDHKSPPALLPDLLGAMVHRLGQSALIDQKPFEVDCFHQITTYVYVTTTVAEQAITETLTAETPTSYVTRQLGKALLATAPVAMTATSTAPAAAGGVCTVTERASSTTTQHEKCAPTNLISEVGGKGIGQTQGDDSNTRGLAPGGDPSACCQLCVETDGCAASEDDQKAGNCFLWYTEPKCGLGFKYSDNNQNLAPGAGFLLQTGCGYIEATDAPTGE